MQPSPGCGWTSAPGMTARKPPPREISPLPRKSPHAPDTNKPSSTGFHSPRATMRAPPCVSQRLTKAAVARSEFSTAFESPPQSSTAAGGRGACRQLVGPGTPNKAHQFPFQMEGEECDRNMQTPASRGRGKATPHPADGMTQVLLRVCPKDTPSPMTTRERQPRGDDVGGKNPGGCERKLRASRRMAPPPAGAARKAANRQ